jgi:hypothetical protein
MVKVPKINQAKWKESFGWTSSTRWWGGLATLLLALFSWFVTYKLNVSSSQKIFLIIIVVAALIHYFITKVRDFVGLLTIFTCFWVVIALYHNNSITLISSVFAIAFSTGFIVLWQEKDKFLFPVLLRHAYLIALLCAEMTVFLAYWIVYDNDLGKALIATLFYYVAIGVVDYSHRSRFGWRSLTSLAVVVVLLGALVLVTMDPVVSLRIQSQ